jgi:hypothetical protein
MNCRHCKTPLRHSFLDLGFAPPSNGYLSANCLFRPEKYYPLRVKVCDQCWLVQTEDYAQAEELFSASYAYFSSTSTSWLAHARTYCEHVIQKFGLGPHSHVVEVASNDGYLLRNFVAEGVPCLGIEPTASTAMAAEALGIPVVREFFSEDLAVRLVAKYQPADLIAGNNVLAHVPDVNDFTRGLTALLKPEGVVTLEFPHLLELIRHSQFDTVYHEHFSYLSLSTVKRIFAEAGLRVWHVEELSTHGGSLRVYGCKSGAAWELTASVASVLEKEQIEGLERLETFSHFQARAGRIKDDLLSFLIEQKRLGKRIAGYGAAAKGNTLLNYAGVKPDLLPYVCDASLAKQGMYLPGSHVPICSPQRLFAERPDVIVILPWNLRDEIMNLVKPLVEIGTEFYVVFPRLERAA